MAYGNLLADKVQSSTAGTPPAFYDGNSAQIGTLCRAWVKFVGSTAVISGSFNFSSVTRTGTGVYTVTFSSALSDANYSVVPSGSVGTGANGITSGVVLGSTAPTASAFQITCAYFGGAVNNAYDPAFVFVSVFR